MALVRISKNRTISKQNPMPWDYYLFKFHNKPKTIHTGDTIDKVCNIALAILSDENEFKIITPEEHKKNYRKARCGFAV